MDINTLIFTKIMRRIRYITAFVNWLWNSHVTNKANDDQLFAATQGKTCKLVDITSQNIVQSPINCEGLLL